MAARGLWSPSRIKSALQCGRRLQGLEEGWTKVEHIRGIRGRAVHSAIQTIEEGRGSTRRVMEEQGVRDTTSLIEPMIAAWHDILDEHMPDGFEADEVLKPLQALWEVDAEIEVEKTRAEANLKGEYKRPRTTKEFKTAIAHLAGAEAELADQTIEVEALVNAIEWPWESDKGTLVEGFNHSLETTRRGAEYLQELWPSPDIIGAEWHLEADLGNGYRVHGYIDRVESTPTGVEVVDYKSSKYEDTRLDHFLQAAVYTVVATAHLGFAPDRVRLAYMRDQDSDVFEVRPEWADRLRSLVASADDVLESKAFSPSFAGCGICGFFPICADEFALIPIEPQPMETT